MKHLSWLGTISSVIGSFIVAFGMMKIGYCFFVVGAMSWLIVGIRQKNIALYTLNGFFFCANVIGLYRAFL
jgi:nicotinamide riboside transporter PnuC